MTSFLGAKVEFGEVSYTVDEGTNIIGLELVRYSDSRSELVVSLTLRDETARGVCECVYVCVYEREREREREREMRERRRRQSYKQTI